MKIYKSYKSWRRACANASKARSRYKDAKTAITAVESNGVVLVVKCINLMFIFIGQTGRADVNEFALIRENCPNYDSARPCEAETCPHIENNRKYLEAKKSYREALNQKNLRFKARKNVAGLGK
jgi:hypothetical protein